MGNNISQNITPPPLTLTDCLINGRINIPRYYWYKRRQDHYLRNLRSSDNARRRKRKKQHFNNKPVVRRKARRSIKKHLLIVRDSDTVLNCLTRILRLHFDTIPLMLIKRESFFIFTSTLDGKIEQVPTTD